jgi:hypothetical protein
VIESKKDMQDSRRSVRRFSVVDNLSVARIGGNDAAAFLHGQLTCDVNALLPGAHSIAGWCNPHGRLLAVMNVLRLPDGFLLTVPRDLADSTIARLRMFVLRSKVTIEHADGVHSVIAVTGFDPRPAIQNLSVASMKMADEPDAYYQIILRNADLATAVARLESAGARADAECGICSDIAAGLPSISSKTSAEFVPQMLNLDLLGGVSFNKGCYPGQEIVARLHFRGGLKGRMIRAHTAADPNQVNPGEPVFFPAGTGDQPVGRIVIASQCGESGTDVLAVVPLAALPDGTLRVSDPNNGPTLTPGQLPYSLPPT